MFTALIVDDERASRIAIPKLLDVRRFQIDRFLEAENGAEALKIIREVRPQLVFADICMPVMDGLEFLTRAKTESKDTCFFIISGYDEFAYAQKAVRLGVSDYLLKPIREAELNKAVEDALTRHFPDFNPDKEETARPAPSIDEVTKLIHEMILTNYTEEFSVTELAARFYFSKEHVSRHFKQKYGCSIHDFLLETRMNRAAELLTKEGVRIQEAAVRTGYTDTNYFSKAFRSYYGCTPSQYRKGMPPRF